MSKKKRKKMPRYKRKIRWWCWQLSKFLKLTDKISHANAWCSAHPKKFFWITVGILGFFAFVTIISLGFDFLKLKQQSSEVVAVEKSDMSNISDSAVVNNVKGLRDIDNNRNVIRSETQDMIARGQKISAELDSLLKLPEKTHEDSIMILQDYKSLKLIVNFLDKGKK